jgi:hypothetical protein
MASLSDVPREFELLARMKLWGPMECPPKKEEAVWFVPAARR